MFATKVKTVLALAFAVSLLSASAGLLAAVDWSEREDRIRTPPGSGTTPFGDGDKKVDDGKPDPSADRKRSADNLKKLAGAMHEYHEVKILVSLLTSAAVAVAQGNPPAKDSKVKAEQRPFDEKVDAKAVLQTALQRAKKDNRRVLIAWGDNANEWCVLIRADHHRGRHDE